MLQQILQDMYIHPDILAELDEEQKQLLFCKMREEQVRRWKEFDNNCKEPEKPQPKKSSSRHIKFLMASDGEPWTWVMGEHQLDKSIEQILEEEAMEKARREAELEAEQLQRQAEEMALKESMKIVKEAENASQKLKDEQKKAELLRNKSIDESQRVLEKIRRSSQLHINEVKEQRENEIYDTLRKFRKKIEELADRGHPLIEAAWREQEEKAKKLETEQRQLARKARAEHRRSLFLDDPRAPTAAGATSGAKPTIAKKPQIKPRASRPSDQAAVVTWFRTQEEPKGTGLDPATGHLASWFHGIIGRQRAEELLSDKAEGSFLIRVSEKVYGYAVSFKSGSRCKHYLVDVTDDGYKLFGLNQVLHSSLADLVQFYHTRSICSMSKNEQLRIPCGQESDPPDTSQLFSEDPAQSSYL